MSSNKYLHDPPVLAAIQRARALLHRKALVGAAVSAIPIPGLDWAADAALLARVLPRISAEFGLTPEQIDQLDPTRREQVQKAVAAVGSVVIGKLITREVIMSLTKAIGVRLTTRQAAKYIPLAGQAAAALLGYATLRLLGEQHIRDCIRVLEMTQLSPPVKDVKTSSNPSEERPRLRFPSPLKRQ